MEYEICKKCERKLNGYFCEQPCGDFFKYLDQMSYLSYSNDNVINEKKSMSEENGGNESSNPHEIQILKGMDCDRECLEDYLEFSVGEDEFFEVLQGKRTIENIIDFDSLMSYLERENEKYCESEGLCPECRSPLERHNHIEEYWGAKMTVGYEWVCPKCG
jgi:hypothetical protein